MGGYCQEFSVDQFRTLTRRNRRSLFVEFLWFTLDAVPALVLLIGISTGAVQAAANG
jgi:hypothetical protein